MAVESRPSQFTGMSFWMVLAYKDHHFEEMLPPDYFGLTPAVREEVSDVASQKLRAKLAPILIEEDKLTGSITA